MTPPAVTFLVPHTPPNKTKNHARLACAWLAGCDQPPAYRAYYAHCQKCGPTCDGAPVCTEHAAHERSNPDLIRIVQL